MSVAQSDVVNDVRQIVQDKPWVDVCTEAMDATETGLDVADGTRWEEGAIVEFEDAGGEQCLVRSVSSNTLTVVRGWNNTTATTHSINATIVRDPIIPYINITGTVSRVIKTLWPYVYKVKDVTLTPIAGKKWYDASDSGKGMALVRAWQIIDNDIADYPFFYGQRNGAYPIRFVTGLTAVTDLSAAGNMIFVPHFRRTDGSLYVTLAEEITDTVTTSNYVDLDDNALRDCVVYGVVAKLIAAYDIPRVTQEDNTMGDETVRPGERTQLGAYWDQEFRKARDSINAHLRRTQPLMQTYSRGTKGIV